MTNPKPNKPELEGLSSRIQEVIRKLGIEKREFAETGGITAQTLSGYLSAVREPSFSVLAKWIREFELDGHWLLTGEGEMIAGTPRQKPTDVPDAEISDRLTPEQRNMLTYKRLQTELGTPNARIADGIEAIVMGRCVSEKQRNYGDADAHRLDAPTRKVQEDREEFGKGR